MVLKIAIQMNQTRWLSLAAFHIAINFQTRSQMPTIIITGISHGNIEWIWSSILIRFCLHCNLFIPIKGWKSWILIKLKQAAFLCPAFIQIDKAEPPRIKVKIVHALFLFSKSTRQHIATTASIVNRKVSIAFQFLKPTTKNPVPNPIIGKIIPDNSANLTLNNNSSPMAK